MPGPNARIDVLFFRFSFSSREHKYKLQTNLWMTNECVEMVRLNTNDLRARIKMAFSFK